MNDSNISDLIQAQLASLCPTAFELKDDSSKHAGHAGAKSGGHYRLTIVSAKFEGMPLISRHRLIYSLLNDLMRGRIHALSITALSPGELNT